MKDKAPIFLIISMFCSGVAYLATFSIRGSYLLKISVVLASVFSFLSSWYSIKQLNGKRSGITMTLIILILSIIAFAYSSYILQNIIDTAFTVQGMKGFIN